MQAKVLETWDLWICIISIAWEFVKNTNLR